VEKIDWDTTLKLLITESANRVLPVVRDAGGIKRWLNVELPKTQNRRVDLLADTPAGTLIHIEIQSRNWRKMPLRMIEYGAAILRRYDRYPLQVVIYAGNEPLRMPTVLHTPGFEFRFEIVDLRALDGNPLLASDNLSDNLLALLMSVDDKTAAIRTILRRIYRLKPEERLDANTRLLLTCELRNLSEVAKGELANMSRVFNPETNPVVGPYVRRALSEGRVEGSARTLRSLIEAKFGALPSWVEERLESATPRQLDAITRKFLEAETLENLFNTRRRCP